MASITITRLNPRTGRTETPFRDSQGYVLGDPSFGRDRHKARFAVRTHSLAEALENVRRGFSIRMSDGIRRPSLISSKSLDIRVNGGTP